jgi:hypothetical protein
MLQASLISLSHDPETGRKIREEAEADMADMDCFCSAVTLSTAGIVAKTVQSYDFLPGLEQNL